MTKCVRENSGSGAVSCKSNDTLILRYLNNMSQSALVNPEMCRGFDTRIKTAHQENYSNYSY